jgi:hypothetical protein
MQLRARHQKAGRAFHSGDNVKNRRGADKRRAEWPERGSSL